MSDWRTLVSEGVIVCPADHARLDLGDATLTCTECARVYPIDDDIPVLLLSDATHPQTLGE